MKTKIAISITVIWLTLAGLVLMMWKVSCDKEIYHLSQDVYIDGRVEYPYSTATLSTIGIETQEYESIYVDCEGTRIKNIEVHLDGVTTVTLHYKDETVLIYPEETGLVGTFSLIPVLNGREAEEISLED